MPSTDPDNTDPNRLWIVSELYYPEDTSTGYYMTQIAEGLGEARAVAAVCGQPNYSKRGTKAPKFEVHNKVEIHRAAGTTLNKNVIPFRIVNMVTLSVSIFYRLLKQMRRGDQVLVVTTPPLLPFIAAIASLVKGASYTLLIHDNYPEILIAVGKVKENGFLTRLLAFANRWLYKYAAKIIVVGRDMLALVEGKTVGLDIPVVYIPNWAELETVEPRPRGENPLLRELGLEEKFVFLYAGNIGYPNDVESIVECAERLSSDPRPHFVFLGAGVKRRWLESAVAKKQLRNVTLLDPMPRSEQVNFLNACDVGVVSLIGKMKGVSMPSRTYNILAAGKPILAIAEPDSEIAQVTVEDGVGHVSPPGDADALMIAIEHFLAAGRGELDDMGRRAREAAVGKYSLDKALHSYSQALDTPRAVARR